MMIPAAKAAPMSTVAGASVTTATMASVMAAAIDPTEI
jgi:hypothetical protein